MASIAQTRFKTALDGFIALLSQEEKLRLSTNALGSTPDPTDVTTFTSEINNAKSRHGARKYGARLGPFLASVQQFSAVIDTIIQGAPDTASFVWGGVKLLLLAATNFFDYFEKLSEMFMKLGGLCPIFLEFQHLFPNRPRLQDATFDFFSVVMDFCAEALKFVKSGSTKQIAKALWKPFKAKFEDVENQMSIRRDHLDEEIKLASETAAHRERQEQSLYRIEGRQHRRDAMMQFASAEEWRLQQDLERKKEKRERLLSRLSDYDYRAGFMRAKGQRQDGSGEWILNSQSFRKWIDDSASSVLLSTGIPGAGKTILTSCVIDSLFGQSAGNKGKYTISYFFCDFLIPSSLESHRILASILRQLLAMLDPLPAAAEALLEEDNLAFSSRSLEALLRLALESYPKTTFYLIVDGLDECLDDERHKFITAIEKLFAESAGSDTPMKLLISCRPEIDIIQRLECLPCQEIRLGDSGCSGDIENYIETRLGKLVTEQRLVVDAELFETIKSALAKGAQGMFLWVTFQLQDILNQDTREDIIELLGSLPRGLNETYSRILRRIIKHRNTETAIRIFTWVAAARRPLSLEELGEATKFDIISADWRSHKIPLSNANLLKHCGNLITCEISDGGDSYVRFAHSTVLKYLQSKTIKDTEEKDFFLGRPSFAKIAIGCAKYLCFPEFEMQVAEVPRDRSSVPPFIYNQPTSWLSNLFGVDSWPAYILKFRAPASNLTIAPTQIHHSNLRISPRIASIPLQDTLSKKFSLLAYMVNHWVDHWAAEESDWCSEFAGGEEGFTQLLLERNLPFQFLPWELHEEAELKGPHNVDPRFWSAFIWSVDTNHWRILEVLCARLFDWENCQKFRRSSTDVIPFGMRRALQLGHTGAASSLYAHWPKGCGVRHMLQWSILNNNVVGIGLFKLRLQIQLPYERESSRLFEMNRYLRSAAEAGNVELIGLLLDSGCSPNKVQEESGEPIGLLESTPLCLAAKYGHLDAIRLLAERDADLNPQPTGVDPRTPLAAAAVAGHLAIVDFLLERDVVASPEGQLKEAIVDFLLGRGVVASPEGQLKEYVWGAIRMACLEGHLPVVHRLLRTPQVNLSIDSDLLTVAIGFAIYNGHFKIVEQLVLQGPNWELKLHAPFPPGALIELWDGSTLIELAKKRDQTAILDHLKWMKATFFRTKTFKRSNFL